MTTNKDKVQGILNSPSISDWVQAFLIDRRAQNLASGSMKFYNEKLALLIKYSKQRGITDIAEITPLFLRQFLIHLNETNHKPGGIHAAYRAAKAFLRWYENEAEPENWKNPINKVRGPKVGMEPLDPIAPETFSALVDTCKKTDFIGVRDKAILMTLLDTGVRAQELLNININEVNLLTGEIIIRQGKGRKPRTAYLGRTSRRALRAYLKLRTDNEPALWVREDLDGRLVYYGLRAIIARRAKAAHIAPPPTLHSFRRAFALNMLRAGVDIVTLARMMGHTTVTVLQRYLKQTNIDFEMAHRKGSPVDGLG